MLKIIDMVYIHLGFVEYTPGRTSCPLAWLVESGCSLDPSLWGPREGTLFDSPVDRSDKKLSRGRVRKYFLHHITGLE